MHLPDPKTAGPYLAIATGSNVCVWWRLAQAESFGPAAPLVPPQEATGTRRGRADEGLLAADLRLSCSVVGIPVLIFLRELSVAPPAWDSVDPNTWYEFWKAVDAADAATKTADWYKTSVQHTRDGMPPAAKLALKNTYA